MRRAAGDEAAGGGEVEAWRRAKADGDALRAYAEAATQIGAREWVRTGIAWMAQQAGDFFVGGGGAPGDTQLYRLARRGATTLSYDARGTPLAPAEEDALRSALLAERTRASAAGGDDATARVKLLDVGACG